MLFSCENDSFLSVMVNWGVVELQESKSLKDNVGKTMLLIIEGIIKDGLFTNKVCLCGI